MIALLVAVLAQDPADRIAIQHRDRVKPFDTFAREMLTEWTGKENFSSFEDPDTGEKVEVFAAGGPVRTMLEIVSRPESVRAKKFLRIQHPELKTMMGYPRHHAYFSLDQIEAKLGELSTAHQKAVHKPDKDRTPLDRAVLALANAYSELQYAMNEWNLRVIPVEYGEGKSWVSPWILRRFLHPADLIGLRLGGEGAPVMEEFDLASAALARVPRERLEAALGAWDAWKEGRPSGLAKSLREVDPARYPSEKLLDSEVKYNQRKPFKWAAGLYALTFLLFLFAAVFASRALWGAGVFVLVSSLVLHLYAYLWRWEIAQRFPLSNQYEAMLAIAFLGALIALVFECVLRSKYVGLGAGLVGAVMIVLADAVADFSPFIRSLPPALQSVWMTIHVPTILLGYVCGAIMAVLGHIYIFTHLFAPGRQEALKNLETYMYRMLQVTVLFLLAGVVLGGVWAKEAWGRFWGWDMKETWALISLLAYLAALHGRFAGAIKGVGTAVASIVGLALVFLTFYGVNYVFGRGLHTYGFGQGSALPLYIYFAVEALVVLAALVVHLGRNRQPLAGSP